jgi:hypothetical protein
MTYTLTVTEEQATVIEQACELLSRCSMGQFDHILWGVDRVASSGHTETARDDLDAASRVIFGPGTGIANCDAQGKRAWDLYQVIRKQLADDSGQEPNGTVNFREPMNTAGEPLAQIGRTT